MGWIPQPMILADVILNENIMAQLELVAENTHLIWAQGRYNEGWRYGPVRDDIKKETPCMVPYSELPESEKEYDRQTALIAIKAAIKFGMVELADEKEG